jgi:hypothetical protein
MSYKDILSWSERGLTVDSLYPYDDWTPLQFSASVGELDAMKVLLSEGAEVNYQSATKAIPQITALHIAVRAGHLDLVKLLVKHADVNRQDQWGFTPVHYATIHRNQEMVKILLDNGGSAVIASKAGTTPLDIATELKFDEIVTVLSSKTNIESDPTIPKFREWLLSLGGGEYLNKFIETGLDLRYIATNKLTHEDLDAVGIPAIEKRGLRRKLIDLWDLDKFYDGEDDGEDEDDEDEDDEDDVDDDDEDEDSD